MKSFHQFTLEAKNIRSKEDADKMRQEKDNPDDWYLNNKGGGHWHPVSKEKRKGQQKRRSQNLKPINKKELEDHAKRNLHPSPSKIANKALSIERARKREQKAEAQSKSKETGKQHDVDHVQGQANRKKNPDRWHRIHPGDSSDNRRVISQADNLKKNSKDSGEKKTTRSSAIRKALQRAQE